ncbi:MAG: hypothetical protein KatS3mg127_1280 [Silanimonas sp.]|jgi:hypothetical protein|nr:MAG: hypothetical protein KatS3mg127_1280 [Silanimonas sp.]
MKVYACIEWDAATGECVSAAWIDQTPFGLPPLSAGEGAALGASVFVLFAVAWLLKRLRRFVDSL